MLLRHINAIRIAFTLLTIIPVGALTPTAYKQSVSLSRLYYPFVGLILGLILVGSATLAQWLDSSLVAALVVVAVWISLSAALHLDGLADSTDALAASHKYKNDREPLLRIMREPSCGPMASIALCMSILFKATLIHDVFARELLWILLPSVIFPRIIATLYMMLTPYARDHGIASDLEGRSDSLRFSIVALSTVSACIFLPKLNVFSISVSVCISILLLLYWRRLWLRRIQGYTGDTLGALIELGEVSVLFALVSVI